MDFSNTSGIRSPFSPRVRQSITGRRPGLSSTKKPQNKYLQSAGAPNGDIVYKTPTSTIETYGMPLPVMVTETLTFASGEVTARLSPCGWCWLVAGRRILAWPREAAVPVGASPAPAAPAAARELTLPQTDLAHKADLVVLFYEDGAQMPSCIGVSPEGTIRYWSAVGQPAVYVDVSAELAGQECDRLTHRGDTLVLATTTCTLVLLTPMLHDGRPTVGCRTLRPPSGWLGGIGRRVSVYLFGSMPTHVDTKLVGVVLVSDGPMEEEAGPDSGCIALVASGVVLQIWRGAELHEHNLRRALVDACARKHLSQGDLSSVEIMALDVRAGGPDSLLLLIAAINVARSPEMKYAVAQISIEDPTNPRVTSLSPLRYDARVQPPKLLPLNNSAVLYTTHSLAICGSNDKLEYIDVASEGDRILGAELCNGVPLLFSRKHGVLVLTTSDMSMSVSMCESPMGSPCPSDMYDGNLSLYEIDPHEISRVTKDACGKLKTAFLFHVRRETSSCRALIEELFPGSERADCVLDRTVFSIATEMLDDIPAGDPRWKTRGSGQQTNIAIGSSAALQIAAQLRDKQRAFSLFVEFLRTTGLWQRLTQVIKDNGDCVSTQAALGELAEWLAIASTLHRLQQSHHTAVIDSAIHQVVCGENADFEPDPEVQSALASGALSPADVCFRRVLRVQRVLLAVCGHPVAAHSLPVVVTVLTEMHKCRSQWQSAWAPAVTRDPAGESRRAAGPLLSALAQLHKRAVTQYGRNCPDANLRSQMLESAATLADLILTDAEYLQRSSHTQHIYENMRREAIRPFMEEGQMDRAAALAEKFQDFELLVEMCVKCNDMDRLYGYIDKYSNEGMSEIAFAWLTEHGGKHSAQLIRDIGARYPDNLTRWLTTAPQRDPLLALHHLSSKEYGKAAKVLANLSVEELESVNRMTTMASLAKLCLLASEESQNQPSDTWNKIESRLALSEQHSALPRDIRTHNGLDTEDTRVVSPEEMIQMYIECESRSLTEYDYKKALDLTDFVPDMERRDELRLKVWCACILRDDWSSIRMDAPSDELQNKMFFRLIDLVHIMGGDLELLLPPVDDILVAPELAELVSDPRFHFIIKYGYECVDATGNQMEV